MTQASAPAGRPHSRHWRLGLFLVVLLAIIAGCMALILRQPSDEDLVAELSDPRGSWCATAHQLESRGAPASALPAIVSGLRRGGGIANCAADVLGDIGRRTAVPPLIPMAGGGITKDRRWGGWTTDDQGAVPRGHAVVALGKIGDPRARSILVRVLRDDTANAESASVALTQIYRHDVPALLPLLRSLRTFPIYHGLIRLGDERALGPLVVALRRFGDGPMPGQGGFGDTSVERYLNSGNLRLERAARDWADAHGYSIFEDPLPSSRSAGDGWGSLE